MRPGQVYWVHVNTQRPRSRVHVDGGCTSVERAVERLRAGLPYGDKRGDANGRWEGPFTTLHDADAHEQALGYVDSGHCGAAPCADLFPRSE